MNQLTLTNKQKKFMQDLLSCETYKGWFYNKDVYDHFKKLGWQDKSFKSVLGSLYKKNVLVKELEMFFINDYHRVQMKLKEIL